MWNRIRYQKFCVSVYERSQSQKRTQYNITIKKSLYSVAEHELERDWTLRTYINEYVKPDRPIVSRLADDIHLFGEMSHLARML